MVLNPDMWIQFHHQTSKDSLVHSCLSYPAHFPLHSLSVGQSDLLTACVRVQGHWPGWPVLPRLARLVSVLTRTRGDRGLKTVGEHPSQ